MPGRTKLKFIGVLPPPLHGQSRINHELVTFLTVDTHLTTLDTSPGALQRSAGYYVRKIARVLWCLVVLAATARPSDGVYISVSSRWGLWVDLWIVLVARCWQSQILLHHHVYTYIDERSFVMSALARAAGRRAIHIFACGRMRDAFCGLYERPTRSLICSVAKFADVPAKAHERSAPAGRPFRVGMLSNLSAEKGLSEFLSLVEQAERQCMSIIGVLAGPVACGTDQFALKEALSRSIGRLQYKGPLYGPAKTSFFEEIDVFLLPTRSESFGLVVVEALAHGVPVIAFARGCIGSYLTEPAGHAIRLDDDFPTAALQHIMAWMSDGPAYAEASRAALRLGRILRRQSDVHFERLLSVIAQQHVWDDSDREEDGFADRDRPAMEPETRLPNDG